MYDLNFIDDFGARSFVRSFPSLAEAVKVRNAMNKLLEDAGEDQYGCYVVIPGRKAEAKQ